MCIRDSINAEYMGSRYFMEQKESYPGEKSKSDCIPDSDSSLNKREGGMNWRKMGEKGSAKLGHSEKLVQESDRGWCTSKTESKDPWTNYEELNMIIAHNKYKNRWSEISIALKGRNNNTIKNKFYSVFRRIKGKIQKSDYSYESKLELLEIYYIISLIEHYLENPIQNPKMKGKRGKDFIYTLVHNLTLDSVKAYKESVQQIAKSEGTMDELITKLTEPYESFEHSLNSTPLQGLPVPGPNPPLIPSYTSITATVNQGSDMVMLPHISVPNYPSKSAISPIPLQAIGGAQVVNPASRAFATISENPKCDPNLSDIIAGTKGICRHEGNDAYFGQLNKATDFDIPLNIDWDFAQPASLFSPPTLSAGPAAAAAGAFRAACFTDSSGEFGEFSSFAKRVNDERFRQMTADFNASGNNIREGNRDQRLQYSGLQYKPYFHQ
eukprot:TRINITY_DN7082_c0_g1_i8.p1 TRINITY_DN7082_c0_g1~~TRINITY_DN7082_c0_g1_i8.p1  ORF type:complete len:454 (+),score=79.25 TRINITY_DN7082_c0_g1_i8:46-1362(+)